jgi:hypothetical protein
MDFLGFILVVSMLLWIGFGIVRDVEMAKQEILAEIRKGRLQ